MRRKKINLAKWEPLAVDRAVTFTDVLVRSRKHPHKTKIIMLRGSWSLQDLKHKEPGQ